MKNAALFSGALVTPSSLILGTSVGIGVGSLYGFSDKPGSENGLVMAAVEDVELKPAIVEQHVGPDWEGTPTARPFMWTRRLESVVASFLSLTWYASFASECDAILKCFDSQ